MKSPRKKPGPKPKPAEDSKTIRLHHYHTPLTIEAVGGKEKAQDIARKAVEDAAKIVK